MRTRKDDLISDEFKPIICEKIKEARARYNYSLEDLAKALNYKKNRQTLHKYETGSLNIPYDILVEICNIFDIEDISPEDVKASSKEREKFEKKLIKNYINSSRKDKSLTPRTEKLINSYKNASFEPVNNYSDLRVRLLDDSMAPVYLKNDKVAIVKQDSYENGDDIALAIKNNVIAIRRLYKYPKGIILQAINPKYPTININVVSNDMIIGKVVALTREIK